MRMPLQTPLTTPRRTPRFTSVRSLLADGAAATLATLVLLAFAPAPLPAQTVMGTVIERGSERPLPGVRLVLRHTSADRAYSVRTDSAGGFRLDGIAAGTYRVAYTRPALRAVGLLRLPGRRIRVRSEADPVRVRLTLPRPDAILAATCPASPKRPAGVVVGVVRDVRTGVRVPGARVSLRWAGGERIVRADAHGLFRACGVPVGEPVTARARFLTRVGRPVVFRVPAGGATRRDLVLEASTPGTVRGRVVARGSGEPVAGAYVRFPEAGRGATTDSEGHFRLEGLPAGTQPLVVEHVAYGTRRDTVRVRAGEVVRIEAILASEAIPLEGITVTVVSERRRYEMSSGTRVDLLTREEIKNYAGPDGHMGYLLLDRFPSLDVNIAPTGGFCVEPRAAAVTFGQGRDTGCIMPLVVLDGVLMPNNSATMISDLPLRSIESIEYLGSIEASSRYGSMGFYGALVIYTRGLGPWAKGRP